MATVASKLPIGVFKIIYILLLVFGLYDVGVALSSSIPVYIRAIPGDGNALVGDALYIGTLIAAGIFIFAVYLSFEAFEGHRGPFDSISMPVLILPRIIEIVLRFSLVAMLTIKLWRPQTDSDATMFVAVVAAALLAWTLIVKRHYSAKVSSADIFGNIVLAFFAIGLVWFSADLFRATYFGLAAVIIMTFLSVALVGFGVWLLHRIVRELAGEVVGSLKRLFVR